MEGMTEPLAIEPVHAGTIGGKGRRSGRLRTNLHGNAVVGEGNAMGQVIDWIHVGHYSFQVMTLLKPTDLEIVSFAGKVVHTFQSVVGPIILALFALALRERLKR